MVRTKTAPPADPPVEDGDVLALGSVAPKPPRLVTIDGIYYAQIDVDALGIAPRERLNKLIARIQLLESKGARATAREETEYDGRLTELARIVLPDAADVVAKLPIGARQSLAIDFLLTTALESPRLGTMARAQKSLGLRPSPASNGTTADPSTNGMSGHPPR